MTERTLGEILAEALEVETSRTYSYEEEGDLFLPPSLFERVSEFGSATVMGRGKDLDYLLWSSDTSEALKYLLSTGLEVYRNRTTLLCCTY